MKTDARNVRGAEGLRNKRYAKTSPHERERGRHLARILNDSGMKTKFRAQRDDMAAKCWSTFIGDKNKWLRCAISQSSIPG